jgi:hypothetical protein
MQLTKLTCITFLALATASFSVARADQKPNSQSPSPASTRTVSGHLIGHYKNGELPTDLLTQTVAAFVPNGTGGYTEIAGTGTNTGTFTIANVPSGFYLLELGSQYLWTDNTKVNADYYEAYRSTRVEAGSSTTLTFDLVNLDAWQDTDIFELSDPNTSAFDGYYPAVGATTFTGTFPYTDYLNDYQLGDKTYFIQLPTQNVGGYPFTGAARFYAPHDFVQVNGQNTTVSGSLETLDQNQTFRANINGADLLAASLAANPGATFYLAAIVLDAIPGSLAHGWTTNTPDLVSFGTETNPITTNGDLGDVAYGNPFPKSFTLFDIYWYFAYTNYTATGATSSLPLFTYIQGFTTTLPTATSPMQLLIGTVTNPLIAGTNFFSNQSGVGLTPTLTWSAPSAGTASVYQIFVYNLFNSGGDTEDTQLATLETQNTSITIPPGILSAGQDYVFQIRAIYRPGIKVATDPYFLGSTNGFADVTSGMVQP